MTKEREALKMALKAFEWNYNTDLDNIPACEKWAKMLKENITAIKEALAQPEPIKIAHKHEWFRTGEMKVGQMRCISCGTWGQEEMPQRKPLINEMREQMRFLGFDTLESRTPFVAGWLKAEAAHGIKGEA